MAGTSPAKAGKDAANRTPEEQAQVLEDAKAPTDKQQTEVAEAPAAAPAAPDDSLGTDADSDDEARSRPDLEGEPPEVSIDELGSNIVRHVDQRVGVISASALAVCAALKLTPNTEWNDRLVTGIKAFQEEVGQKPTGYLTPDQCRRLGLVYLA